MGDSGSARGRSRLASKKTGQRVEIAFVTLDGLHFWFEAGSLRIRNKSRQHEILKPVRMIVGEYFLFPRNYGFHIDFMSCGRHISLYGEIWGVIHARIHGGNESPGG